MGKEPNPVKSWRASYVVHPDWTTSQAIRNANWLLSYELSALRLRPMSGAQWKFEEKASGTWMTAAVNVRPWRF